MDKGKELKSILGEGFKEHVVLRDYATMKVGGVADYFYLARTIDELVKAITAARQLNIPYEILGGGSNVIISDFGFGGLLVLNRTSNLAILEDKAQAIVDSGVSLARLIIEAANHNLGGLEAFYGIPGTVGGAVYGNAGSQDVEICQLLKSLTLFSPQGKIVKYPVSWLEAGYRTTKLKKLKKGNQLVPVILSAKFQLSHNKKEEILRKIAYYKKLRQEKQPYNQPSAGSIFKNPGKEPEKSAGYILERIGAKRTKVGDARVSKKHANFIINYGKAKAVDIRSLIDQLRDKAREKEGIILEEEIEYIGQW